MTRNRALLLPIVASLLALPVGCGGSDDPGNKATESQGSDSKGGNADDGTADQKDTTGAQPDDGSGTKPDDNSDNTGGGGSKSAVKPSEGSIDCATIKSTGIEEGDVAPNVTLLDAGGNKTSLHDYCNDYVLVVAGGAY